MIEIAAGAAAASLYPKEGDGKQSEKDQEQGSPQTSKGRDPSGGLDLKDLISQSDHHLASSSSMNAHEDANEDDDSNTNMTDLDQKCQENELEIQQLVDKDQQLGQEI